MDDNVQIGWRIVLIVHHATLQRGKVGGLGAKMSPFSGLSWDSEGSGHCRAVIVDLSPDCCEGNWYNACGVADQDGETHHGCILISYIKQGGYSILFVFVTVTLHLPWLYHFYTELYYFECKHTSEHWLDVW